MPVLELDFLLLCHGVLLSAGGLRRLAAVGGLSGPLAPPLQRRLHPALGHVCAVPQTPIRQAGPVLAPGQFLVDHMNRHARGFGNFFRRPPVLPQLRIWREKLHYSRDRRT